MPAFAGKAMIGGCGVVKFVHATALSREAIDDLT
jgi:hypothetical protein